MKLYFSKLIPSGPKYVCENAMKHFFSSRPDTLYHRITPLGDPKISIVPVLDQWVREGRDVNKHDLRHIIKELQCYRRFKHALEVSQWMTERRYLPLTPKDILSRLNLLYRVHGLEKAEMYYNGLSEKVKGFQVYTALLNCYIHEKSVEKAEGIMQKLRDTGLADCALPYNHLMNLYYRVGSWDKLDILLHEMEKKGINGDKFTFNIRLSAYAAASNREGLENVVTRMESDPRVQMDSSTCAVAANGYFKVGLVEKGLQMLKKLETVMKTSPTRRNIAYDYVLTMYAQNGKKEEVHRIWNMYKKREKIFNRGYMSMISALLKFDDIEGAESIFEEWESRGLSYDLRIPNCLIKAYMKNSQPKKAEDLINWSIAKGGNPTFQTWYCLAGSYIEDNQVVRAIEALKKATQLGGSSKLTIKDRLVTCLEYLEGHRDSEDAEEFILLLEVDKIFSKTVCNKLLSFIILRKLSSMITWQGLVPSTDTMIQVLASGIHLPCLSTCFQSVPLTDDCFVLRETILLHAVVQSRSKQCHPIPLATY